MASNLRSRAKAKAAPILSPKASTSQGESSSPPPGSGDDDKIKCAICLGDLQDKSYSNSCCHQFCFGCLLEWSKVKPECPLCKSSFTTIIHNIRSDSSYDEYQVPPPPIPILSVPIFHHFQDDIMALRSHRFHPYGPAVPAGIAPSWYHRDRMNFRILEYVTFNRGADYVNPFRNGQTEFFGTSINMHNDPASGPITNYQARRRIYDRNQWVEPSRGTLSEGSVVFPSVDYIRTHPAARARITSWLHRELTVLLGLQMAMHEMASVFDVIMRVLETWDIRSPEFRELVTSYFGDKTRHFQHEFFNFVISGMSVEEYDRNACYNSNRNSRANAGGNVAIFDPPIVTLDDSSDDDNQVRSRGGGGRGGEDDSECVLIMDTDGSGSGSSSSMSSRIGNNNNASSSAAASSSSVSVADMPWDLSTGNSMDVIEQMIGDRLHRHFQRTHGSSASTHHRCADCEPNNNNEPTDMSWRSSTRRGSHSGNLSRASMLSRQCRNYQEVYDRLRSQIAGEHQQQRGSSNNNSSSSRHENNNNSQSAADIPNWSSSYFFHQHSSSDANSPQTRQRSSDRSNSGVVIEELPRPVPNVEHEQQQVPSNDDDCVLLGVHPVVKKPPLAIITISDSDDEGNNSACCSRAAENNSRENPDQCKNEVVENPEVQVSDVFMEMFMRDQSGPTSSSAAARRNYVNLSSSSSRGSSRAPSPMSSRHNNNINNHHRPPPASYYIEPSYPYDHHNNNNNINNVTHPSSFLLPSGRRRESLEVPSSSPLLSSRRLRLLDSKKPKSSKRKKSSSGKKHRSTSGSRKKKRNRSVSSSSSDGHKTRKKKSNNASSKKSSSKKKKSRRNVIISSSSSSSSEDSEPSSDSSESSIESHRRKSKHKKSSSSSIGNPTNKVASESVKGRSHKSKKKRSSSSGRKKSRHNHHQSSSSKKSGPLSREYLSSTESSSSDDEPAIADHMPKLIPFNMEPFDSSGLLNHLVPSTSSSTQDYPSTSSGGGLAHEDRNPLLEPPQVNLADSLGDVLDLTEALTSGTSSGDQARTPQNNFDAEPPEMVGVVGDHGQHHHGTEDWDITSTSPYFLNLTVTRDGFWS